MKEAARAQQEAERAQAEDQRKQDWAQSMQAHGEQMKKWGQSEQMRKWQEDMDKWGQEMGRWGQEFGRQQAAAVGGSEARAMPPMPPMPAMPAMPPAPPAAPMDVDVTVPAIPHGMPGAHVGGGGAPRVALPHIDMPTIEPPVPPPVPQRQENQEEVVSRTEHTIDLTPGRLLEVKNEMGSIAVRGSNEPGCKLVVTVKGRADTKEEAQAIVDRVKPLIRPSQDGVYVAMTKPEKEVNQEHTNRVVTMELVVPRDAQLRLSQAFGDIRLANLSGSVRAVSNMGAIRASDVRGRVVLESNFGSIDFLVPKGFSAKVQAKSQMGSIQSDLPVEVVKSAGLSMGSRASGTIGSGEGDVSLTTNMGSIRIRSESSEPGRAERSRPAPQPRPEPRPEREF